MSVIDLRWSATAFSIAVVIVAAIAFVHASGPGYAFVFGLCLIAAMCLAVVSWP